MVDSQEFMRGFLREIVNRYPGIGVVIVIDNSPEHYQMENVFMEREFGHHKLVRLEPYSAILNPIEIIWIVFKSYVKRKLGEYREGEDKIRGKRNRYIMRFMTEDEAEVTDEVLEKVFSKVKVHYKKFIRMKDMEY